MRTRWIRKPDQPSSPRERYDVFLSHNSVDKLLVEVIALQLKDAGLQPFLDKWHLAAGRPWQEELEVALESSATCAVFIGPSGLGPWQNEEMRSALDRRVHDQSFRVIPVLLPGDDPKAMVTLPSFLSRLTYVDFRAGLDDQEAFHRLLAGIRGTPPESELPLTTWLTIKLARGNSEERNQAARQLGALKNPAAISILESRWSQEPDPTVRYWLALALGEISGELAIAALHRIKTNESNQFALSGVDEALETSTEQAD